MAAVNEKGTPTKTQIIETGGPVGGLKCKTIGHVCPPDEHKELKGTIKSILEQAEKAHSQSVVFPLVLKAGEKEITVDKVAKYCYKGVCIPSLKIVMSLLRTWFLLTLKSNLLTSFSLHLTGQVVTLVLYPL